MRWKRPPERAARTANAITPLWGCREAIEIAEDAEAKGLRHPWSGNSAIACACARNESTRCGIALNSRWSHRPDPRNITVLRKNRSLASLGMTM
jgi:hypothetical protein